MKINLKAEDIRSMIRITAMSCIASLVSQVIIAHVMNTIRDRE